MELSWSSLPNYGHFESLRRMSLDWRKFHTAPNPELSLSPLVVVEVVRIVLIFCSSLERDSSTVCLLACTGRGNKDGAAEIPHRAKRRPDFNLYLRATRAIIQALLEVSREECPCLGHHCSLVLRIGHR